MSLSKNSEISRTNNLFPSRRKTEIFETIKRPILRKTGNFVKKICFLQKNLGMC